jgi:hypothetical protein
MDGWCQCCVPFCSAAPAATRSRAGSVSGTFVLGHQSRAEKGIPPRPPAFFLYPVDRFRFIFTSDLTARQLTTDSQR